jgi:hypothetical protein
MPPKPIKIGLWSDEERSDQLIAIVATRYPTQWALPYRYSILRSVHNGSGVLMYDGMGISLYSSKGGVKLRSPRTTNLPAVRKHLRFGPSETVSCSFLASFTLTGNEPSIPLTSFIYTSSERTNHRAHCVPFCVQNGIWMGSAPIPFATKRSRISLNLGLAVI